MGYKNKSTDQEQPVSAARKADESSDVEFLAGLTDRPQDDGPTSALKNAVRANPSDPNLVHQLAAALRRTGQLSAALICYRKVLQINPELHAVRLSLGNTFKRLGRLAEAVECFRLILVSQPNWAEVHYNMGNTLRELGQVEAAIASYRKAVEIKPNLASAHTNLGSAYDDLGKLDIAINYFRSAAELDGGNANAHNNLGAALSRIGKYGAAAHSFSRALEIDPLCAEVHNNLGEVLKELGRLGSCTANVESALGDHHSITGVSKPDDAFLNQSILSGNAIASYRAAIKIKPDYLEARSNLIFALNYIDHSTAFCLEEASDYGEVARAMAGSQFATWACQTPPLKLRVGLVSGDLRQHPVGNFLESVLSNIDRNLIELIAYPTHTKVDRQTLRIKASCSAWKPLVGLSDEAAVQSTAWQTTRRV